MNDFACFFVIHVEKFYVNILISLSIKYLFYIYCIKKKGGMNTEKLPITKESLIIFYYKNIYILKIRGILTFPYCAQNNSTLK